MLARALVSAAPRQAESRVQVRSQTGACCRAEVTLGGLGLLEILSMDLGQVEVIKGVASALLRLGRDGRSREPDFSAACDTSGP